MLGLCLVFTSQLHPFFPEKCTQSVHQDCQQRLWLGLLLGPLFLPGLPKAGPALAVSTASPLSFHWLKRTSCPHDSWCVPSKRLFQNHVWFLIPAFLQPAPGLTGWSQKHQSVGFQVPAIPTASLWGDWPWAAACKWILAVIVCDLAPPWPCELAQELGLESKEAIYWLGVGRLAAHELDWWLRFCLQDSCILDSDQQAQSDLSWEFWKWDNSYKSGSEKEKQRQRRFRRAAYFRSGEDTFCGNVEPSWVPVSSPFLHLGARHDWDPTGAGFLTFPSPWVTLSRAFLTQPLQEWMATPRG